MRKKRLDQLITISVLIMLSVSSVSALTEPISNPDSTQIENHSSLTSAKTASPHLRLKAGIQTGFPYIFGHRLEYILQRSPDQMPNYLITWDLLFTLGFGTTLAFESRLGQSPFYISGGYNFTMIVWVVPGLGGGTVDFHSPILTVGIRGSLNRNNLFNVSLGCWMNRKLRNDPPLFPVLALRIMSK